MIDSLGDDLRIDSKGGGVIESDFANIEVFIHGKRTGLIADCTLTRLGTGEWVIVDCSYSFIDESQADQ